MSSTRNASKSTKTQLTETTETTDFSYRPNVSDLSKTPASPSLRTHATDPSTIHSSSMRSSLSSNVLGLASQPPDDTHVLPLSENPYCFEESDEEEDREKKAAKKHKKKKKSKRHDKEKRRSSNESSDRQSSRRTMDSSDSHHRKSRSSRTSSRRTIDSSDRHREHHHNELEPLGEAIVSPRKERRERRRETERLDDYIDQDRRERQRSDEDDFMLETSDEFLRKRREHKERLREEGLEVETLERRQRRERRERRKEEDSGRNGHHHHHHHHHASSVGANHRHHHHSSSSHRPHSDSRHPMGRPEEIRFGIPIPSEAERAAALPAVQRASARPAEMWSPRTRQAMQVPTTIDVPTSIDVIVEQPRKERDSPRSERKPRHSKSDYDRLRQLLQEQSDKSDSDSEPSEGRAKVLDKLHPLISASDEEFQEAFDNLAKDSVFDDNFEKAFNEFSEHYLALSPWGEDDSTGMKEKCDDKANEDTDSCFIQIPLTPVSKKGLTNYIAPNMDLKNGVPGTPVLEKGYLTPADLHDRHGDLKKKESQRSIVEGFVEVSRTPYARKSSYSQSNSNETPEGDDSSSDDLVHRTSDHSSSRARSEPSPVASGEQRRQKWGILRGRRQQSKATV